MLGALFGPAAYAGGEHFGALHITRFGLVSRILKVDPWICRARRIARDACVCVCVCPVRVGQLLRQVWVVRHLDGMGDLVSIHGLRRRQSFDKQRSVEPTGGPAHLTRVSCAEIAGGQTASADPSETPAGQKACWVSSHISSPHHPRHYPHHSMQRFFVTGSPDRPHCHGMRTTAKSRCFDRPLWAQPARLTTSNLGATRVLTTGGSRLRGTAIKPYLVVPDAMSKSIWYNVGSHDICF